MNSKAKQNALVIVTEVIASFGAYITDEREIAERLAFMIESDEEIEAMYLLEALGDDLSVNQTQVIESWIQSRFKGYMLCEIC